ncbi:hypothetical protein P8452_35173 [Trifolium repens]|nr:hypothetical protein P8452_35173 [Trifolium repens]
MKQEKTNSTANFRQNIILLLFCTFLHFPHFITNKIKKLTTKKKTLERERFHSPKISSFYLPLFLSVLSQHFPILPSINSNFQDLVNFSLFYDK